MLTEQQRTFYDKNGYLLAKGLFSPEEAAAWRRKSHDLIDRLAAKQSVEATWGSAQKLAMDSMVKTELRHCHNVQFYDAAFTALLVDDRLTSIAAELIGSDNVQLHHNKMFIKPPAKGSPFPMHQDHPFFPHEKHSMIAAIIHFDAAPEEKGCVRAVAGSHKLGPVQHVEEGGWHLPFEEYPLESADLCEAEPGDVLFFSYLTIHGSGVNRSDEARTTLLLQMRDPSDPPIEDVHQSRGQGMMLRGIDPLEG